MGKQTSTGTDRQFDDDRSFSGSGLLENERSSRRPERGTARDRSDRPAFLKPVPGCVFPNCPLDMEKRDASQTGVCVTERLSGSIVIERRHLTRHAIYAP